MSKLINYPIPYPVIAKLKLLNLPKPIRLRAAILLNSIPTKLRDIHDTDYYEDLLQTALIHSMLFSNDNHVNTAEFIREVKVLYLLYRSPFSTTPQTRYEKATTIKKTTIKLHPRFYEILQTKFQNARQEFVIALANALTKIPVPLSPTQPIPKKPKPIHISVSIPLTTYFQLRAAARKLKFRSISALLYAFQINLLSEVRSHEAN